MAAPSRILALEIPWTEELDGLQAMRFRRNVSFVLVLPGASEAWWTSLGSQQF